MGLTGPGAVIPFCSPTGTVNATTNAQGQASTIYLLNYGNIRSTGISMPGGLDGGKFTIPKTGETMQLIFTMPYDATVSSVYATFTNYTAFTPPAGSRFLPFVAVATAQGNYDFTVIKETVTPATGGFVGGTHYLAGSTMLQGNTSGLSVSIPAGSLVAILAGWYCDKDTTKSALIQYIYTNGGILLS